jgi:hypothetical protein
MKKQRILTLIVVALVTLLFSAGPVAAARKDVPRILSVNAQVSANNALIVDFEVEVNVPSKVYVDYKADGVEKLRSKMTDQFDTHHSFSIVRLRPETIYSYKIFARDGQGNRSARPAKGTFTTGPLPAEFDNLSITPSGETSYLSIFPHDHSFVGIDEEGVVVWYALRDNHTSDIDQLPDGNFIFSLATDDNTDAHGHIEVMDALGNVVRSSSNICPADPPYSMEGGVHHEVMSLEDDTVLYLGRISRPREEGDPGFPPFWPFPFPKPEFDHWAADAIRLWDPTTGTDEMIWNLLEHVDLQLDQRHHFAIDAMGVCDPLAVSYDWSHCNGLEWGLDNNILLSSRHLEAILSIERVEDANGQLQLGDIQWYIAAEPLASLSGVPHLTVVGGGIVDDTGALIPYSETFYAQHAPQQLDNGNILLFDNGIILSQPPYYYPYSFVRPWSRALELDPDFVNNEARVVWQYTHSCEDTACENDYSWHFAPFVSNAIRLDNGNTLIDFGTAGNFMAGIMQGAPQIHRIVEVGPSDENNESHPVAEIVLTTGNPPTLVHYRVKPIASLYGEYYTED